jgi:hypothetical protein
MKLGKYISKGRTRRVYQHPTDKTKVIKHTVRKPPNHNSREYAAWQILKDTEYRESIAPCYELSECHKYLVMAKAPKIKLHTTAPKMPIGFKDIKKRSNLGHYEGRIVLIDYGNCTEFLERETGKKWHYE